ncbi:hypothetical protein GIB67_012304 [Kingdonia uniflora]|uniref:Uncharacterized protein n=1 Tax=Kingdonia uniflora TaxID=39325 RepID=A0A7J7MVP4_9MAGN|nr:hypothetical protein GIB67_012304 [Kingdonia uniflora]
MRCTRHPSDLSSTIGVCATCLRERLFILVAAQLRQQQSQSDNHNEQTQEPHQQPPLIFPRSVSPYICHHQRSDYISDRRFFCTPQVGPTFSNTTTTTTRKTTKKKKLQSLLSSLFHRSNSRSKEFESDPRVSGDSIPSSSSSWFSSLISHRRHNHKHSQSRFYPSNDHSSAHIHTAPATTNRRSYRGVARNRGMSPNITEDTLSDEESGYSSESSRGWRKSAMNSSNRRLGQRGNWGIPQHSRNVSGLAFCLSPLVRAKETPGNVIGFSGEICQKPQLSTNRSRKLADFGRQHHQRNNNNCKNNGYNF